MSRRSDVNTIPLHLILSVQIFSGPKVFKGRLSMDFPQSQAAPIDISPQHAALAESFKLPPLSILQTFYEPKSGKLLVELDNLELVRSAQSDATRLMSVPFHVPVRGVSLFTAGLDETLQAEGYDFASRYFAPWVGILEDPVNGLSPLLWSC